MTHPWDLVVVGAGPAGTSTALAALEHHPGLRVLLLDRADFPRDKSCGDGIAPHVLDTLAGIGVTDLVDDWAPIPVLRVRRGDAEVAGTMARPVRVVPRAVFDARLVDRAVAAGAELRAARVVGVRRHGDLVAVDTGSAVHESGRVVVGADGAHSVVRRAVSAHVRHSRPGRRRALAIRGYAPTPPERRGEQLIVYADRPQPAYAWAFDRGDGLSNVGYGELLHDHRPAPTRRDLLARLEALVPGAASAGDWRGHHLPLSGLRWDHQDGPVLLAGDAAGLVNPMTGEGLHYAVSTGVLAGRKAAEAVIHGAPDQAGRRYRRAVRGQLGRHLRHTSVTSRLASWPRVVDAGIAACRADTLVFDDLVEIGLGQGLVTPRLLRGLGSDLARPARPDLARKA